MRGSDSVLLDTGPLLTLLALEFLRETEAGHSRRVAVLQELRGKEINRLEEERFTEVFANYQRKLTTPHVLTEVFKLRDWSQLKRHEPHFRKVGIDTIKRAGIREITASLAELASNQDAIRRICLLGLTDAALLYVSGKENWTLLTDDRPLLAFASGQIQLLDAFLQPR
jgi:hypothetical protein